jgi:cell division protein FtsL
MFRFTARDWLKVFATALAVVAFSVVAVAVFSQFGRQNNWRFIREGIENIDEKMKQRDETIDDLQTP